MIKGLFIGAAGVIALLGLAATLATGELRWLAPLLLLTGSLIPSRR